MKNVIKKIIGFLPLIIGSILIYGIASGNIEGWINNLETDKKNEQSLATTYPVGVIENYKDAFEWYEGTVPVADVYDPDNKIKKSFPCYGYSVDEGNWYIKCNNEDLDYNKEHKLSEKYLGNLKYNPDKIVDIGETFDRKYLSAKSTIDNIEILDNLENVYEGYFTADGRSSVMPFLSENGSLENMQVYNRDGLLTENQNLKFVKITISLESFSEWVEELELAPELNVLKKEEDDLLVASDMLDYFIKINSEMTTLDSGHAIYIDLGFFDYTDPECEIIMETSYPMRKGEKITYSIMYVVPEAFLDDVYLVFNDRGNWVEYTYNLRDITIVKVKNG